MKKLFILIGFVFMVLGLNAQTVVKYDDVKSFSYSDTLEKEDSYQGTVYFVKDFATTVRFQLNADSLSSGYTKVSGIVYGSLDAVNYVALGDSITLSANGADSDVVLYSNVYYNYLKPVVRAIDSTQYSEFNWNLLIDKN